MRPSVPILLSVLLLGPVADLAFAQDGKQPEERSTAAPAGSPLIAAIPTRAAALPGDHRHPCLGFLEFEAGCDAPAAHLVLLPQSPAQVARAAQVR